MTNASVFDLSAFDSMLETLSIFNVYMYSASIGHTHREDFFRFWSLDFEFLELLVVMLIIAGGPKFKIELFFTT